MTPSAVAVSTAMRMASAGDVQMSGADWIGLVLVALFFILMAYDLTR